MTGKKKVHTFNRSARGISRPSTAFRGPGPGPGPMLKEKEKAKYSPRPNLKQKGISMSQEGAMSMSEPEEISQPV